MGDSVVYVLLKSEQKVLLHTVLKLTNPKPFLM